MKFRLKYTERRVETIVLEHDLFRDQNFVTHFERIEQVIAAMDILIEEFELCRRAKAKYKAGPFDLNFFKKHPIPLFQKRGIRDIAQYLKLLDEGDEYVSAHYEKFVRLLRMAIR